MLTADETEVWVEDLATTSGVYLITKDKKRKIAGAHRLQIGDVIKIGENRMQFWPLDKKL